MIQSIIDHLHDDKTALEACSLVCKTWTRSAQFHLFSDLIVTWKDVAQLVQPASVVIPLVRHLRLYYQDWNINLPLLVGFESIKSLTISDLVSHSLDNRALLALHCNFSAAVILRLKEVYFDNISDLVHFVCAFPRLQALSITQFDQRHESGLDLPTTTTFHLSPHLVSLELYRVSIDGMLNWMLSLPTCPALHTLCLDPSPQNNPDTTAKFLRALDGSLESLFLSTSTAGGMFSVFINLIRVTCEIQDTIG
jgi:hypothetical protein